MDFSITFIKSFLLGVYLVSPILILLWALIVSMGLIVGQIESWRRFDSIYWAFITALTVGYGDIRPLKKITRVLAIFIACVGIMFAGILVAITVETAHKAFKIHVDPKIIEQISSTNL